MRDPRSSGVLDGREVVPPANGSTSSSGVSDEVVLPPAVDTGAVLLGSGGPPSSDEYEEDNQLPATMMNNLFADEQAWLVSLTRFFPQHPSSHYLSMYIPRRHYL